jgi:hypothetical protein
MQKVAHFLELQVKYKNVLSQLPPEKLDYRSEERAEESLKMMVDFEIRRLKSECDRLRACIPPTPTRGTLDDQEHYDS